MEVPFNLTHVFYPSSDSQADSYVLKALLDALIKIDLAYLRAHTVKSLYSSGVRYGRTTLWEPIPEVLERGYGDCKSLAAWRVAELLRQGVAARVVHRWRTRQDSGKLFHILVQRAMPNGSVGYEDPSKVLGMGKDENAHF